MFFSVNDGPYEMAFENADFKNGGYAAAVAALHEGANFSLTLPNLED